MKATVFCFIAFWSLQSLAQSTNVSNLFQSNMKKADLMYAQQGYRNAIDLYLIVLDHDPRNELAKERLADCYYRMGQFRDAKRWYVDLSKLENTNAEIYYQLGQSYSILKKYDSAKYYYELYSKGNPSDKRGPLKVDFIQTKSNFQAESGAFTVTRQWYNSNEADFSPRHFGEGIVFVSSRDRDLFIKRKTLSGINETEGLLNAYYVDPLFDITKTSSEQIGLFYSSALNSRFHDGPVTFFDKGSKIAFTRNILRNGKPMKDSQGRVNLELFIASLGSNRTMNNIERYAFNDKTYSIAHPWMSEDGKTLYFSSNMPGGFGGADLYVSYFRDQQWTRPENLGVEINTPGDEFTPFLWNAELLFFSSNGLGGFGGLDNYIVGKEAGKFGVPRNMGYLLNTSLDDFGLIVDPSGDLGLFASNRGGNDDVFSFGIKKAAVIVYVQEKVSGIPMPLAGITITGEGNEIVRQGKSDENGNFMVRLDPDKEFKVRSAKEGYTDLEEHRFSTRKVSLNTDSVKISIWKNGLFATGVIYSNELQERLPDAMVYLKNLTTGRLDSMGTTNGEYKFLVLPNNTYRIRARHPGYLENGFNLNTHELYKGDLFNDILLEETYQEKLTMLFDYNKWDLRSEFHTELGRIIRSLNRFKDATVYIGAHADAQGTREYNKALSDKRAKTILEYLKSKNIKASRIQAFGFGEELILNTCSDGVECSDIEHSQNRRAEIKVQRETNN